MAAQLLRLRAKTLKETYTLTVGLLDTEAMLHRAALVETACQWGGPLPNPTAGDDSLLHPPTKEGSEPTRD